MSEYVVLEWNQASHQPRHAFDDLFDSEEDAIAAARDLLAENRKNTRREGYSVHELGEMVWQDEDDERSGVSE